MNDEPKRTIDLPFSPEDVRTGRARQPLTPLQLDVMRQTEGSVMSDEDAHWRAGLAQVRAQAILKLVQLYEDGEADIDGVLEAIREQAQAILDGPEKEP